MNLFERDIAVDMGTSSTLLFEQGKGVVAREPTVVAVDKFSGKILKIGQDAQKMLGRTPANIVAIHPINAGVISDYEITAQMLRELVSRLTSFSLFKPCVLACVPSSITGVEERAVIDAAIEAGARKVYLLETAVATAMGAGVDISKADGHMIIDIGGGTTEVAIVSAGGVVECKSIKVAGSSFDEAIVRFIKQKYELLIGLSTAEELKRSVQEAQRSIADAGTQLRDAGEHARSSLDEIRKSTEGLVADATRLNGDAAVDPRDPEAVTGPALPPEAIAGDPTRPPVAPIDDAEDARGAAR